MSAAAAESGEPAADTSRHFGLVFDVEAAPHLSSLRSFRDGGFMVSLGFGVNFSPRFLATLNVYTGAEHIPPSPGRIAFGNLAVGGASVEATYFLVEAARLRPYAACGFGLYTDLVLNGTEGGYSGGGPHAGLGVQLELSRYFALRTGIQYAAIYFHNPVGGAASSPVFAPFTAHIVGISLRMTFYPAVAP